MEELMNKLQEHEVIQSKDIANRYLDIHLTVESTESVVPPRPTISYLETTFTATICPTN